MLAPKGAGGVLAVLGALGFTVALARTGADAHQGAHLRTDGALGGEALLGDTRESAEAVASQKVVGAGEAPAERQVAREATGGAAAEDEDLKAQEDAEDDSERALVAAFEVKKRKKAVPVSDAEAEHEREVLAEMEAKEKDDVAAEIAKAEREASEQADALKAEVQLQKDMETSEADERDRLRKQARESQAKYEADTDAERKLKAQIEATVKAHGP